MTGIYLPDLKAVVKSACDGIYCSGDAAVVLVTGTILCEGGDDVLNLFQRTGHAPTRKIAWGISQMEPSTHDDCWTNFISYKPMLKAAMMKMVRGKTPNASQLIYDLRYACAMTRVKYLRDKDAIPEYGDDKGMANYWKKVYNTYKGSGVADSSHVALFTKARQSAMTDLKGIIGL